MTVRLFVDGWSCEREVWLCSDLIKFYLTRDMQINTSCNITPHYPNTGGRGRPPTGLERMLRMYIAQQCFGLSDEATEDARYDSQAIRHFVGIDLNSEAAPLLLK